MWKIWEYPKRKIAAGQRLFHSYKVIRIGFEPMALSLEG